MSKLFSSFSHGLAYINRTQTMTNSSLVRLASNHYNYFSTNSTANQHILAQSNNNRSEILPKVGLYVPNKSIFTAVSLGIDKLEHLRSVRSQTYESSKDRYIERLSNYIETGQAKSIFKDDLINLIALAENEQHLDLIEKIAISTNDENDSSAGSWGSAVMRLYYKMNLLDRAYNNLKSFDKFGKFFNQRTSYQIVMSMLYNVGRYEDVIEIYNLSLDKLGFPEERRYKSDRILSVIVFAACAKMNTPESLEIAEKLYAEDSDNPYLKMRVVTFLSYLAVNQNKPILALNLLSDAPGKNYISLRELKTLSLLNLKRYEDVLYHLRECVNEVRREYKVMLKGVHDIVENTIQEIEDGGVRDELTELLKELNSNNLIGEEDLTALIFREINRDNSVARQGRFQQEDSYSAYSQSSERRPYNRNSYGRQSYGRQSYGEQSYDRQSYDRQSYDRQSYDRQSSDRQSYDRQPYERQPRERQSNGRQPYGRQSQRDQSFESYDSLQ